MTAIHTSSSSLSYTYAATALIDRPRYSNIVTPVTSIPAIPAPLIHSLSKNDHKSPISKLPAVGTPATEWQLQPFAASNGNDYFPITASCNLQPCDKIPTLGVAPNLSLSANDTIHSVAATLCSSSDNLLTLILVNARSLLPKMHYVKSLCTIVSPSFMCITETWLCENTPDAKLTIPGYDLYRTDRQQSIGGGCAIYVQRKLKATTVDDPHLRILPESVWLSITSTSPPILLGCIYSPPAPACSKLDRLTNLFSSIGSYHHMGKLVVGDFNLPDIQWHTWPQISPNPFLSQISMEGWYQHVTQPTRGNHTLDLIFSHNLFLPTTTVSPGLPGCDHHLVTCTLKCSPALSFLPLITYHRLSPDILTSFGKLIRLSDWSAFFLSTDTQYSVQHFYGRILSTLALLAPPQTHKTGAAVQSQATRLLEKKIRRTRNMLLSNKNFSLLIRLQRLLAKFSDAKTASELAEERKVASTRSDPKALSRLFRRKCSYSSDIPSYITLKNGAVIEEPHKIVDEFNKFFASCYRPSPSGYVSNDTPNRSCTPPEKPPTHQLQTIMVSLHDVTKHLQAIKSSRTPGPDGIPPLLLKKGGPDLHLLIQNLFNISLRQGVFPTQWKSSIIIPRHKSGSRAQVDSYRGIHHTSHLSRTLERIVKDRLVPHLLGIGCLDDRQYGFLAKRSVRGCQTHFFHLISNAHNEGKSVILIYLDITKAFDHVPHSALIRKLKAAAVAGPLLDWFQSYLTGRLQQTTALGLVSTTLPITSGVIQGSVLGPILFLLYINNLFTHVKHGEVFLFADDVKIVYASPPSESSALCKLIQHDLDALTTWSSSSCLQFSPEKSHFMSFRCFVPPDSLNLCGSVLPRTDTVRDLGIRYSCTFDFSTQATYAVAKARQISYLILRSFHLHSTKVALYKQRVRPLLELCAPIASYLSQKHRLAVEGVQRRFTKALFPGSCLSYRARCAIIMLEPLWLRRLKLNLVFLHAIIHSHAHLASNCISYQCSGEYNLRNSVNFLSVTLSRTALHYNSFFSLYSRLWNMLPATIRNTQPPRLFRHLVSQYLCIDQTRLLLSVASHPDNFFESGPPHI